MATSNTNGTHLTDANFKDSIRKYYLGTPTEKQEIISAYGTIEKWIVFKVTNMFRAFSSDPSGNIPGVPFNADISKWNMINVTTTVLMFENCSVFNQDLSYWFDNPYKHEGFTECKGMFVGCSVFNSDLLSQWNMTNVTDMGSMFESCSVFNQDLSSWRFTTTPDHEDWCTGAPICDDELKWPTQLRQGITDANLKELIRKYYLGTPTEKQEIISTYGIIEDWMLVK